jgi:hypothetical protein
MYCMSFIADVHFVGQAVYTSQSECQKDTSFMFPISFLIKYALFIFWMRFTLFVFRMQFTTFVFRMQCLSQRGHVGRCTCVQPTCKFLLRLCHKQKLFYFVAPSLVSLYRTVVLHFSWLSTVRISPGVYVCNNKLPYLCIEEGFNQSRARQKGYCTWRNPRY